MTPPSKGLAAGAGGLAAAAAGWIAAQRYDRNAIRSDPKRQALFAPLGGERQTVRSADGTGIAVRTFGPEGAPTIVLVHGWTCASPFWKLQVGALTRERRIVAYDLRGHGHSERAANRVFYRELTCSNPDDCAEDPVPSCQWRAGSSQSGSALPFLIAAGLLFGRYKQSRKRCSGCSPL